MNLYPASVAASLFSASPAGISFREPERVKIEILSLSDWEKVPDLINDYVEEITEIGMNPYKGF